MLKSRLLGAVGIVVVGCVAVALAAQAPAPPAFEVASIKSADPNRAESISRASDRLTVVNQSVQKLILWAFHISDDRLLNQPGWINSARYDVVAKAPTADLPIGRVNEMTQSLLAERFNLAVHWETREGQRYALRVDRGGLKVRVVDAGPGPRPQSPFRMDRNGHLTGLQVSAAMLATVLSDQLGRFVADETGLDGVFDFTLDWAPDATQQSTDAAFGASLFTAVQEQLGLKLESTRGPVDVLVIDHVERPTPD